MIEFNAKLFDIKNPPLKPVLESEFLEVEIQLNLIFPSDYKYISQLLGAGEITSISLQIFTPYRIRDVLGPESRNRLKEFWFWTESSDTLTQQKAIDCFPFFGSTLGDEILFHPSNLDQWFILPRHDNEIIVVHNLDELISFYLDRESSFDDDFTIPEVLNFQVW